MLHALAYDEARKRTLLFGGLAGASLVRAERTRHALAVAPKAKGRGPAWLALQAPAPQTWLGAGTVG